MPFRLTPFAQAGLNEQVLQNLLAEHETTTLPRLERLWRYYRNPATGSTRRANGRLPLAQEEGLPRRLRSAATAHTDDRAAHREIVIENDIAWRVHTLVDFLFGKRPTIVSLAPDSARRRAIEQLLEAALEASGGAALLQDMALLGAVFGHVDLLLRAQRLFARPQRRGAQQDPAAQLRDAIAQAQDVRFEIVEPRRGIPLLRADDFRVIDAYVVRFRTRSAAQRRSDRLSLVERLRASGSDSGAETIEIFSAQRQQRYENGRLVLDAVNPLGAVPVVHVQHTSQPFHHQGMGEVEPLIPLQDELNTRLSDRANRVTMQSFKMYLAKGLEGFADGPMPIGPGQIWATDNPDASIEAFGADAESPSEEAHIEDLREAMDKVSAVTPLAAGVLRSRLGSLSSENALRVTLIGLLAKVARLRVSYGGGLTRLFTMALQAFDAAGAFPTAPEERRVRLDWPDPLPRQERDVLEAALRKLEIGVPRERVLAELGYAPADPDVA